MSSKDDLFGGLSESDSEENVENKGSLSILQDLAMSDEDEETTQEYSREIDPITNSSHESVLNEEYYQHPREETDSLESDYSSSVPTLSTSSSSSSGTNAPCTSSDIYKRNSRKRETSAKYYNQEGISNRAVYSCNSDALPSMMDTEEIENGAELFYSKPALVELDKKTFLQSDHQTPAVHKCKNSVLPIPTIPRTSTLRRQKGAGLEIGSSFKCKPMFDDADAIVMKEEYAMANRILLSNFSEEQLDRYVAFRRQAIKNVIAQSTGQIPSDPVAVAIGGLAKLFVGDLVEEAVEMRDRLNENNKPVQPQHIKNAFNKLVSEGKLWPPYGKKC